MSIDNAKPEDWNSAFFKTNPATLGDYIKSKQIGGSHYKSNIEPWDVFLDWQLDPWLCNVIKYVQRHNKKNGLEDLEKAKHYLEFAIANYDKIKEKYYVRR